MKKRAFTLIELLTVIAISSILLTLIVLPVFQSFNYVRDAQSQADSKSRATILSERIKDEVNNSVAVRGGGRVEVSVNGTTIMAAANSLVIRVPRVNNDGTVRNPRQEVELLLPYVKMDMLRAAQKGATGPSGAYIDPITGKEDPTLKAPKGQVSLPVTPGATMVRYAIGLRDPFKPYNNPYEGLLATKNGGQDNLYVLYRFEVLPRVFRNINNASVYAANLDFFDEDSDNQPIFDDPRFLLANLDADGMPISDDAKATRIKNWLAKGVVQTELSRYDMIETVYNKASRRVANTNGIPQLIPMMQFRPSRISSEPAEGQSAVRLGEETDNGSALAPDTFTTKMGLWSNAITRTWPVGWDSTQAQSNEYLVGRADANNGLPGFAPGFSIYAYDPDSGSDDVIGGIEVFDVDTYTRINNTGGRFAFSQAVNAANARSNWLAEPVARRIFTPYSIDAGRGRIVDSFAISEVGDISKPADPDNPGNYPTVDTGLAETPKTATDLSGNFYDAKFNSINARFNKVFDLWEKDRSNTFGVHNLDQSRIQRFIDLRVTPTGDGATTPLRPELGLKASIVPGSDMVEGPDQNPGPNYGQKIRYTRVAGTPGINQYRINYADSAEPTNYGILGVTSTALAGFDATTYDPQNFTSAILQPQFKAGYIQLNSDPNAPLPEGPVRVSYRFQFTKLRSGTSANGVGLNTDVFAVDYDSRELMTILVSIRTYPQTNLPNAKTVTLQATAKVRNYTR
jgi:prepilin-type N-terminal cleavage/methylation domain-containing protein